MSENAPTAVSTLILGESHCTAISRAIVDSGETNLTAIDVRVGAGPSKINEELFANLNPCRLILAFGGTEHNILGLVEAEPRFDFIWPPFEDFIGDRCLVPASALEELLAWRMHSALTRALSVRERFSCPVYALAPPPAFRVVDERAKLPSAFNDLLAAGIAPGTVRRKLYAMQCDLARAAYAKEDITYIPAPPAAVDEDGYLLRALWNKDPTHGNRTYGRLVVDHLKDVLDA